MNIGETLVVSIIGGSYWWIADRWLDISKWLIRYFANEKSNTFDHRDRMKDDNLLDSYISKNYMQPIIKIRGFVDDLHF